MSKEKTSRVDRLTHYEPCNTLDGFTSVPSLHFIIGHSLFDILRFAFDHFIIRNSLFRILRFALLMTRVKRRVTRAETVCPGAGFQP